MDAISRHKKGRALTARLMVLLLSAQSRSTLLFALSDLDIQMLSQDDLEQKYGKDLKIKYDKAAQPDFSGHLKAPEVNINVSGDSVKDAASAWAQLEARGVDVSRLKTEDLNFHHAGGGRMQLIDADLNRAFAHTGEAALVRANKYAIIAGILAPSTTELIASSQRNGTVPSCGRTFFVAVVDQLRWMDPGFESLYHATKENTYSKVKDELQFRKKHPTAFYYRIEPKL
jgi:hypothetical protein